MKQKREYEQLGCSKDLINTAAGGHGAGEGDTARPAGMGTQKSGQMLVENEWTRMHLWLHCPGPKV